MKLIQTENSNYIFDSYSNEIVKTNDISLEYFINNKEEIRSHFIQKGLFNEPYKVKYYDIHGEEFKKKLNSNLNHLVLGITNQCNFRCKYCAFSGIYPKNRTHSNDSMNEETAFKAVDFFLERTSQSKRVTVGFYGGEPLLKFNLIKKIVKRIKFNYSKDIINRISFAMTTNAALIDNSIADFLVENKFNLAISLDGPPEIHDEWRVFSSGQPTFNLIDSKLKFLKTKFPEFYKNNITFEATITPPFNLLKIDHFFNNNPLTKEKSARYNYVSDINGIDFFKIDKNLVQKNLKDAADFLIEKIFQNKYEEILNLIKIWIPIFKRLYKRKRLSEDSFFNLNGICTPCVRKIFVNHQGEIFICEKLGSFKSFGTVFTDFDSEGLLKLLSDYKNDLEIRCVNCWAKEFCSMCYLSIADGVNINYREKDELCKNIRKKLETHFKLYFKIMERKPNAFEQLFNRYFTG